MIVKPHKTRRVLALILGVLKYYDKYFEFIYYYYLSQILVYICRNWLYFFATINGYASLLAIGLNGVVAFMYNHILLMQYVLNVICLALFSYVTFTRVRQTTAVLKVSDRLTQSKLYRFTQLHTQVVLDIFEANHIFGYILLAFMLFASPTSAYQLILILTQELIIANVNLIIYKFMVLGVFHLVAGLYTNRIHQCRKRLFHLNASNAIPRGPKRIPLSIRSKVHLALYIEKFNCKKRYGITYK